MRFENAAFLLLTVLFFSCNKSSSDSPDSPSTPPLKLKIKSIVKSYNYGNGWQISTFYNYAFDTTDRSFTIHRVTLGGYSNGYRNKTKFIYLPDNKRISNIIKGYFTTLDTINVVWNQQMDLNYTGNQIFPSLITTKFLPNSNLITYESYLTPWERHKTSTETFIEGVGRNFLIGVGTDSIKIKSDLDYPTNNIFVSNIPGYQKGSEIYHKFYIDNKGQCTSFIYQNGVIASVQENGNTNYFYAPTAEQKIDFKYNANLENSADSIFKIIDPTYNNPWTWIVDRYSYFREPLDLRPTFNLFQNVSSSYSDSLFTFSSDRKKQFFSVVNYTNEFFKDSTGRISSLIKRNSRDNMLVKFDFFYEN
jgi:hypothetical protein